MLAGRVGTKQVHDAAVRLASTSGVPFRDDLVIDTAAAHLAAMGAAMAPRGGGSSLSPSVASSSPYIYPPPLMGRRG